MFKFLNIVFILFLGCQSNAENKNNDSTLVWHENLESAIELAKEEDRYILMNFTGSDWCIWCKRLSGEVFVKEQFTDYASKNLVLVKIDFPRSIEQSSETKTYNNGLAYKYGVRGFPSIILLDSKGKLIAKTGYQPGGPENYIKHLKKLFSRS
ncbi:thioredoxin family protein [Bacteroidota bacterium]